MKNIAVMISGGGTNLQSLIDHQADGTLGGRLRYVVSNRKNAFGLVRAAQAGIENDFLSVADYESEEAYFDEIAHRFEQRKIDLIVLAGFLKVLPESFTRRFRGRIINIHPSLIPSYSGVGFYGRKVHEAVVADKAKVTGATVHFVDEGCDTGPIILQSEVPVFPEDDPDSVQARVLIVEHQLLPLAVKKICDGEVALDERGQIQWNKKEH